MTSLRKRVFATLMSQYIKIKHNIKHYIKHHPRFIQFLLELALSISFGLGFFLLLYGRFPLYFSNVNWIYNNSAGLDSFKAQIGWEWFRRAPWSFPMGRIEAYGYPFGTNISYMDSIPLLAISFKILSPWLGVPFQYLGIWELASIIGQILVGMLILDEFTRSYPQKILGALLLALTPILIQRAFRQDSLSAQWIILVAIWFILLEYRHRLWRGAWLILFAVAMLVHLYIVAMLFPLWAIGLFFHYQREKKKRGLIVDVFAVAGVTLLIGYCTGLFGLSVSNLQGNGFGFYSWNLNGFFNAVNSSTFLKSLALGTDGQSEGFSYLGLGNLFIFPTALYLFLQKDQSRHRLFFFLPFGIVALLLSCFALSQKAFFGAQPLWDIHIPGFLLNLCSIFRASGRFIWPVFYFLVLFGLISILRNFRYPTLILVLALSLQYFDLQPLVQAIKFHGFEQYQYPLQADFWQQAAQTNQHVMLLPASYDAYTVYEPFALYANQNNLTLNWGYFSRANYAAIEGYGNQVFQELIVGHADPQTIYIIWKPDWIKPAQQFLSAHMFMCHVDGYSVVLSPENKFAHFNNLSLYCSPPAK